MKLAALVLSPFEKIICLEPDILFLKKPMEIISFIMRGGKYYGAMKQKSYDDMLETRFTEHPLRKLIYLHLRFNAPTLMNGGLLMVERENLWKVGLKRMEKAMAVFQKVFYDRMYFTEETLLATMFDKAQDKALPDEKYVNLAFMSELNKSVREGAVFLLSSKSKSFIQPRSSSFNI